MEMEEEKEREVRVQVPWNLQALFLPGLQQQGPICQSMQENQLQEVPWSDTDRGMLAGTLPRLDNITFGELLALANVASVSSTGAAPPGYGMDSAAMVNSPSDSCRMDSSSGILNPGFSLTLQTWFDGERARENPDCGRTDELSASRHYFYDLNLPPEEMMNMNPQTNATEFAPITPEKPTRILTETQDSCSAEKTDQERGEAVKGSLLVTSSAARKKNKKTQKREGQDVEQIKTPQQKPRRKKHRPKVVIEGRPKRPSKLEISKPAEPRGGKSGKKRNVKRKEDDVELMPLSVEAAAETSDLKSCSRPKRSTRRVLNFNYDTEEEESFTLSPSDFPELHVQEKLCMNAANEFSIHRVNQVRKSHTCSGRQEAPSIPMLIFSNIPKRRRRSTPADRDNKDRRTDQASEGNDHKHMPHSTLPIGYEHTPLSEGRLTESAKGKNPTINDQADTGRDFLGLQCSSLHMFPRTFWVQFPNIRRKRRTDRTSFATPSTSASVALAKNIVQRETISQHNPYMAPSEGLRVTPQWLTDLTRLKKFRRKRSRTITRATNFDSLKKILEACDRRRYKASHKPQSLEVIVSKMQLTVSRKKRTQRNSILSRFNARRLQMQWGFYLQHRVSSSAKSTGTSLDKLRKQLIPIDEISEWLEHLDISRESPHIPYHEQNELIPYRTRHREQNTLVPHRIRHQEQNALVLYKRDGTIIPLESSLYPYKKQHPRPMVKIDDETTRVWKLLMANINNEGVDGTDEEKEKWWEEERRVFQGRTDSFIARMRLVQVL